jgi:glycosyl transferase, family 25
MTEARHGNADPQPGIAAIPVFLINLDRDQDRLRYMQYQLAVAGLRFTRVPAVLGAEVPEDLQPYFWDTGTGRISPLKPGEIGCYASHLVILQEVASGTLGPAVLVLEDDLQFAPDFAQALASLLSNLPKTWDIIRLSNPPKRAYVPVLDLGLGRELVRYSKIPNNTGAYLISPSGAKRFLQPSLRLRAIDEEMRRPWSTGLDTYGVVPPFIVSNIFDSSIDMMEDRGLMHRPKAPKVFTGRTEGLPGGIKRARHNIAVLGFKSWRACLMRNATSRLRKLRKVKGSAHADFAGLRVSRDNT